MKAILLAGGKGTRLRPLTIHTPKPVVPIFDRAFLHYQIDLLKQVPEIDEVILSLNYQPRRIEEVFGDGAGTGVRLRYVVEPSPLGTGGAIRYAAQGVSDTIANCVDSVLHFGHIHKPIWDLANGLPHRLFLRSIHYSRSRGSLCHNRYRRISNRLRLNSTTSGQRASNNHSKKDFFHITPFKGKLNTTLF